MVRIRLRRIGLKGQPTYRIIAADKESPRDGRFLEILGVYNPRTNPATIHIKEDRVFHWMKNGALPTESVAQIFKSGQRLQVHLSDQVIVSGMMFSVHSLHENILVRGAQGEAGGGHGIVVTTNVYLRSGSGWRMVLHHGSPAPTPVVRREVPVEAPKVLH